jgi:hypothetical protein
LRLPLLILQTHLVTSTSFPASEKQDLKYWLELTSVHETVLPEGVSHLTIPSLSACIGEYTPYFIVAFLLWSDIFCDFITVVLFWDMKYNYIIFKINFINYLTKITKITKNNL